MHSVSSISAHQAILVCAGLQLEAERREHNRVAAKCAALEAMFQSHGKQQATNEELVTELKNRLKTERTWWVACYKAWRHSPLCCSICLLLEQKREHIAQQHCPAACVSRCEYY